ncbi:MAG: UDP-N-acetylmuramoyl-tripeptide--D-alanyl-D-alanine ligase [Bacteroidota bacterium]|nr:UDP-N-acetylmuramoyl-tripeptide--D-alanyl-D-alanine ligase [Bacteroidota bacterium]MDX5469825.1 UDP-N-acetylmuramoyl-tripeptide--D-alanyl-D-alanine ligase [Bacteroidota bacterium]
MDFEHYSHLLEIYKKHPVVSTDSRNLPEGCMFFALRGANFDGNQFAGRALELGAGTVVIDNADIKKQFESEARVILVRDALKALQEVARLYREELAIPVVAIGGSNGKTTTKELLHAVLSTTYRTHATRGNFNNHIGLPLTLLSMPADTELAVIELGTNRPGDIAELLEICEPDFGLITNIGKEHLEGFGSLEGVAREESELFLYLNRKSGLAFVNTDDPWLDSMAKRLRRMVSYGSDEANTTYARYLGSFPGVSLELDSGVEVHSQLPGAFNFSNVLAAFAVARHFNIPDWITKTAVESYVSQNNRSQVLTKGDYTFLLDCYNANPSSMELALKSLAEHAGDKFFILGDMLELGSFEEEEHQEIVALVHKLKLKEGIFIGPAFKKACGEGDNVFDDAEAARAHLEAHPPKKGTLIFLKGSRGIAVEKSVAQWIKD